MRDLDRLMRMVSSHGEAIDDPAQLAIGDFTFYATRGGAGFGRGKLGDPGGDSGGRAVVPDNKTITNFAGPQVRRRTSTGACIDIHNGCLPTSFALSPGSGTGQSFARRKG